MKSLYFLLKLWVCIGFSSLQVIAQNVTIIGNFQAVVNGEPITVFRPVNGFFNVFYAEAADEAVIKNNQYSITLPHTKAGFFRLQSKGISKTYFYAEPSDTIFISFTNDKISGETVTQYKGAHAQANNLLAEKQLFNDRKKAEDVFAAILENAETPEQAFSQINEALKPKISAIQKLYQDKFISKSCMNAFIAETQQKVLNWNGGLLYSSMENPADMPQKVRMGQAKIDKLLTQLYQVYDPFTVQNRIATTNYVNCHTKSRLMLRKNIAGAQPKNKVWSQFEGKFGTVVNQVPAIDYAPLEVQKYFIGHSLLTATAFNSISDTDFNHIVTTYVKLFPDSPYLPILNKHVKKVDQLVKDNAIKEYKVFLKDSLSATLTGLHMPGTDTVTSIGSLVKNYFKGKPLFIDYWASWCSPCIAEFKHEAALHKFLANNNIDILYVSIDKIDSKKVWETMVNKYKINGYHYLANPAVSRQLNNWFQGIPRYMLFGADGSILSDNLPRPSQKQLLYDQIQHLITREENDKLR